MSRHISRTKPRLPLLALGLAFTTIAPFAPFASGAPVPQVAPGAEAPAGQPGDSTDTGAQPKPPEQPKPPVDPNLGTALRRALRASGAAPVAGPKPPVIPTGRGDAAWNGPRSWEVWWELNRDRYVQTRPRDLSLAVDRVPPDPRTSVQVAGARVGSYERIEPTLRLLLTHEKSELVLARALLSLAKLGEDPRVPGSRSSYATILSYLHHPDSQLCEAAITALGILGTEEALFPLGDIVDGARPPSNPTHGRAVSTAAKPATDRKRALALYSIGMIGRDSSREDVRRLAASRICASFAQDRAASAEVKFAALHALSLIPLAVDSSRSLPEVVEKPRKNTGFRDWRSPRSEARSNLPTIPSASRDAEVDWALSVLDDDGEAGWIRAQAVTAAARLCADLADGSATERRVVERLLKALAPRSADSVEIEQSAALALGELGDADSDELDARVRSVLAMTAADASDQSTREFASLSLALVGSRPGGEVGEADRLSASGDVRKLLLHRASSARANELPWAVLALGIFEHGMGAATGSSARESRAALANLLSETNSAEHAAACSLAIGLCGATPSSNELIARLRDGDVGVRSYAALALGMIGAREAGPALEALLADAQQAPELFRSCSDALTLLGAPVSRQLLAMMVGGISLESQMSLCTALGRVGDSRALHALSQVACDGTTLVWVRAAATSALGSMGSPRSTAWNADLGHALNFTSVPATLSATSLDGLLDLE